MIEHIKNIFKAVKETAARPSDKNRMIGLMEIATRELKFYDHKSRQRLSELFDQVYCEGFLDARTNRNPAYSNLKYATSRVKTKVDTFWRERT